MNAHDIVWATDLTDDEERRREHQRRKRELYLFLFHLALACVPSHLFAVFLLYLLYWSKP